MMQEKGEAVVQTGVQYRRPETSCYLVPLWCVIFSCNVVARAWARKRKHFLSGEKGCDGDMLKDVQRIKKKVSSCCLKKICAQTSWQPYIHCK